MPKTNKYGCRNILAYGHLTNDTPELTIVTGTTNIPSGSTSWSDTVQYLRVTNLNYSIYQPAKGGGGKVRFQDQAGNERWHFDVNGVKEISQDFGEEGVPWEFEQDIKAIVYGAADEQAKLWISVTGHIEITGKTT